MPQGMRLPSQEETWMWSIGRPHRWCGFLEYGCAQCRRCRQGLMCYLPLNLHLRAAPKRQSWHIDIFFSVPSIWCDIWLAFVQLKRGTGICNLFVAHGAFWDSLTANSPLDLEYPFDGNRRAPSPPVEWMCVEKEGWTVPIVARNGWALRRISVNNNL